MSLKINIEKSAGVYAIVHCETNRMYIGSSVSIKHRIWKHFSDLRKNKHCNTYLQAAFNKYGESEFACQVLQVCSEAELLIVEAEWIERKKTYEHSFGFNLIRNPSRVRHSDETRKKMSESSRTKGKPAYNRGLRASLETRRRVSEAGKGRIKSVATCEKLRQAMLGESHPHRGKTLPDETRQKMSKSKHAEPPIAGRSKGVSFDKRTKTFQAKIYANGSHRFLGRYKTEMEAAVAYNDAAIVVFGDGCFLNHIVGICVPNRRTVRGRIAVNG
jgi:group I intron endonuclease